MYNKRVHFKKMTFFFMKLNAYENSPYPIASACKDFDRMRWRSLFIVSYVIVMRVLCINIGTEILSFGLGRYGEFSYEVFYLGIEFYLFVSHGGMNDRGSTCIFRNARIFPFWLWNIYFLIHKSTRNFDPESRFNVEFWLVCIFSTRGIAAQETSRCK